MRAQKQIIIIALISCCVIAVLAMAARNIMILRRTNQELQKSYLYPDIAISKDDKHIVFAYKKNGISSIYICNSDGTDVQQITYPTDEAHLQPQFSPDDSKILFISYSLKSKNPEGRIGLVNADGSDRETLLTDDGNVTEAIFSRDGRKIYFLKAIKFERYSPLVKKTSHGFDIYAMTLADKSIARITNENDYSMADLAIFGDETGLLFCGFIHDNEQVYYAIRLLSMSDGKITTFFKTNYDLYSPFDCQPSPNGNLIAFQKRVPLSASEDAFEIFLMDVAGKSMRQVTNLHSFLSKPAFFHNQNRILFMQDVLWGPGHPASKKYQLMQIDLDGLNQKKIDLEIDLPRRMPESFSCELKLLESDIDISDKDKIEAAKAVIDSKEIRNVSVEHYEGKPYVLIELTENGKRTLDKVTSENIGKRMAIVSKGRVITAPKIMERVPTGSLSIQKLTEEEAQDIVHTIKAPVFSSNLQTKK